MSDMPSKKPLYVVFTAAIDQITAARAQNEVVANLSAGYDEVRFLFSSTGGFIVPGINLTGFLKALSVPVSMHNIGQIDSIGCPIFSAGARRIANPNSSFLFHGVSWTFAQSQSLPERQLFETAENLKRQRETIARVLSDNLGIEVARVDSWMLEGKIMFAQEALKEGLIHEIAEARLPEGGPMISIA